MDFQPIGELKTQEEDNLSKTLKKKQRLESNQQSFKKWYDNNKIVYNEKRNNTKHTCDTCGITCARSNLTRHLNSKTHIRLLKVHNEVNNEVKCA